MHCRDTRALAAKKLGLVEARIRDLSAVRRTLRQLIGECDAGSARESCPIIDSLNSAQRAG
jgi:MerR family mercuric resistance operon transcriptional regulator